MYDCRKKSKPFGLLIFIVVYIFFKTLTIYVLLFVLFHNINSVNAFFENISHSQSYRCKLLIYYSILFYFFKHLFSKIESHENCFADIHKNLLRNSKCKN